MPLKCQFCGSEALPVVFSYESPPPGETLFNFGDGVNYYREYRRCAGCGHFFSQHALDLTDLYSGAYVSATYGEDGLKRQYDKIMNLDPQQSDNVGRVNTICAFAQQRRSHRESGRLLDIGSGLAVFPARMQQQGWQCTALDPDARAVKHAQQAAGVEAICADFMQYESDHRYDAVSFNKVLEHVTDPIAMLERAKDLVDPHGFVYVELPDGEMAARAGKDREEFYIDHWHVFSLASGVLLAERAGFDVVEASRLIEPSGKYTLRYFLEPGKGAPIAAGSKETLSCP